MSSPHRALFIERSTRLLVLWLLAFVLPLQGTALAVFAAKGPAHLHTAANLKAGARPLVLEDVRRWKPSLVAGSHLRSAREHTHAGRSPLRHHHARSDASVVVTGADAPETDEAVGSGGLSVLALIPSLTLPSAGEAAPPTVPRFGWQPRTGFTVRLDRPPRLS